MFTLLAPFALVASALLAVPVAIHLLKPKRVRTMPFSSLRWLRTSQHKLSRRIQWHQVLLFLLRAAFLIALVLALAKPVFSNSGKRRFTERFVILDVSRSMNYEEPGKETPFIQGKKMTQALLAQGMPGDRATILLTGNRTKALGPLSDDPTRYAGKLSTASCGLSDTDLGSALAVIRPMLADPRPNTVVELDFITDSHQGAWSESEVAAFADGLKMPVSVKIIDVGPPAPRNAWISDARMVEAAGQRFLNVRLSSSGKEPQERTVSVKGLPELRDVSQRVAIAPGAFTEVNLPLPAGFDVHGKIAELLIEPRDALPDDDQFWLDLDARASVRLLMLEPNSTQIEKFQPSFPLRTAFAVLGQGDAGAVQVTRRTPESVTDDDLAQADAVVMVNVPELTDGRLLALEARVQSGAGLLMFLGPAVQTTFYNTKLHHPQNPMGGLLPRPLGQLTQTKSGLAGLTRIAWTHPLLAPLFDPVYGDLARVHAHSFYLFDHAPKGDTSEILAWFDDVAPALIEHSYGAGRVLIVNSTANDEWSDLSRHNSFVPLIDQALNRLARARLSGSFHAGEAVALALPVAGRHATATVTTPSGRRVTPSLQQFNAQTILRLDDTNEAGVYSLKAHGDNGGADFNFVVQVGRGDSVVAKADEATLRSWWGHASFDVIHPDPGKRPEETLAASRVLLWPWLFGLAALLLLAEMYFVHGLCPVMNPAAACSSVARQGILAPTTKAEVVS